MLTRRGFGVLALAVAFYAGARLFGTFELYLMAFGFLTLVGGAWLWTLLSARGMTAALRLNPPMLVAGDALEATISVSNRSLLPSLGCGLRLSLEQMGADYLVVESPVLLPRRSWNGVRTSNAVWRGVYDLEPPVFAISDPLGVARVRRVGSDRLRVVVVPRIPQVRHFNTAAAHLLGVGGLGGGSGRGAGEFRSIRPHQPGEPLNRIHWPSTARANALMLREMEDAPRADCMVVLDGWRASVVGERPHNTFEKQVELVGALADGLLCKGRPVLMLAHGARDEYLNLEPTPGGRRRLRLALAGVSATAAQPVGEVLARAVTHGPRVLSVAIVSAGHDPGLMASLQHLARSRVGVVLVHVSASSYLGRGGLLEEESRFLVRLQGMGISLVLVGRDDDPAMVLSASGPLAPDAGAGHGMRRGRELAGWAG